MYTTSEVDQTVVIFRGGYKMDFSSIAVGIVLLALIVIGFLVGKITSSQDKLPFDERQMSLRLNGYRIGFITILILVFLDAFFMDAVGYSFITPALSMLTVGMIGLTVYTCYCIVKDAYLSFKDNGKRTIAVMILVVVCNGFVAVSNIQDHSLLVHGRITIASGGNLIFTICFSAILLTLLVHTLQGRCDSESEDDR